MIVTVSATIHDVGPSFGYDSLASLTQGTSPVTYRLAERGRFLRAGFVTPRRGGSGNAPGRHDDRSARSSLDWDRKERVTPVEQRTIFRTIGVVRSDQVPGSAQLELSGGVRSLPQAP